MKYSCIKVFAALLCFFFIKPAYALEIYSNINSTGSVISADLDFSGIIVKDIRYSDGIVIMPVTEYKDQKYFDVRILSQELYKDIEACLKRECRYGETVPDEDVGKKNRMKGQVINSSEEMAISLDKLFSTSGESGRKKVVKDGHIKYVKKVKKKYKLPGIKVAGIESLESKIRIGNVNVIIDDGLQITVGVNSKRGIFLSYPKSVKIENKELENLVETEVRAAWYSYYKREEQREKYGVNP